MFAYENNSLSVLQKAGSTSLLSISQKLKKPYYVYDLDGILARLKLLQAALPGSSVHFAMKANNNSKVLTAMAKNGAGADVVSQGEFEHALKCGFAGNKIVFSGVAKTSEEIRFALSNNVKQINVESIPELSRVADIAKQMNLKAPVALRMNPDVAANTHPYIRTGFRENKFGLDFSDVENLAGMLHNNSAHLNLCGLTMHIGSQIRETAPFVEAIDKIFKLHEVFLKKGFELKTFDIGGGLGIDYHSDDLSQDDLLLHEYAEKVSEITRHLPQGTEVLCEPGRFLVARFGALIGEIQYIKETPFKTFVILNTGMNHLLRPALYQAYHRIIPIVKGAGTAPPPERLVDIVGPICESTDTIGHERLLSSSTEAGDWLAIMDAGAYGAVMASNYNLHTMPEEIVISEGRQI